MMNPNDNPRHIEECWNVTSKPPIGTIWIDTHKGGEVNPEYRSRFVAQQIKYISKEKNNFLAKPQPEARKLVFFMPVT